MYVLIYVFCLIMYMMKAESKLRSFNVNSLAKYKKFAEIQRSRGKGTGERLNELIEQEVKLSDPFYRDKSAAQPKSAQERTIPNPFVFNQFGFFPIWREYLATLNKNEIEALYLQISSLKDITNTFPEWKQQQEKLAKINSMSDEQWRAL
jgi:hypothetical protein